MNPDYPARVLRHLRSRFRAPASLLWLLLVNTLAVAGLSAVALRAELAQTDAERRAASEHALSALAARVEHLIYQSLQEPAAMLRGLGPAELEGDILRRARELQPAVVDVLLVSPDFRVLRNWPVLPAEETRFVSAAVQEHVLSETRSGHTSPLALRSFSDGESDPPLLYVLVAADDLPRDVAGSPDWWVFGVNTGTLAQGNIAQMLAQFRAERGVEAVLQPPGRELEPEPVGIDLGSELSGWRMELQSPLDDGAFAQRANRTWIALAVAIVLGMALVSAAIVHALRREQALVELRNRFVANVSHELKTPLSLIRMYAETLTLGRMRDPARVHEYHRVILAEAERLSRMIEDVLMFASVRRGAAKLRMDATDMAETLMNALATYLPQWQARGARVTADIGADLPLRPHDPQAILQVLLYLVDNAIAYAGPEPAVELRLAAVGADLVLDVEDHGPGMSDEALERVQRALARGSPVAEAQGTGLGLALVSQIARAHGATLEFVRGSKGSGIRVRLCFAPAGERQ
jgi:signal transduction histidine kinase